jgi:hypothetical protein
MVFGLGMDLPDDFALEIGTDRVFGMNIMMSLDGAYVDHVEKAVSAVRPSCGPWKDDCASISSLKTTPFKRSFNRTITDTPMTERRGKLAM